MKVYLFYFPEKTGTKNPAEAGPAGGSTRTFTQFSSLTGKAGVQTITMKVTLAHRRQVWMMLPHVLQVFLVVLNAHHQTKALL